MSLVRKEGSMDSTTEESTVAEEVKDEKENTGGVFPKGARVRSVQKPTGVAKIEDVTEGMNDLSITGTGVAAAAVMASLNAQEKETVEELRELQSKYKAHFEDYEKELNTLKAKYEKLYKPLYQERAEHLVKKHNDSDASDNGTPGLPSFWLKCLKNSNTLSEMIEPCDEPILAYLQDISSDLIEEAQPNLGFKLIFKFATNPYFDNNIIVKKYNMSVPEGDTQTVLNTTESTTIEWKEGKNPTKERVERKQRNKRTKQTRTVTEDVDKESFFNFFCSQELPSEEELEEMPDQQVSDLELMIEADYEMGLTIREKIIPHAVSWFFGEMVEEDEEFDEGDLDDEEDDDDDDEEDESYTKPTQRRRR